MTLIRDPEPPLQLFDDRYAHSALPGGKLLSLLLLLSEGQVLICGVPVGPVTDLTFKRSSGTFCSLTRRSNDCWCCGAQTMSTAGA